jgi:integrase/recombinase XerD
MSRLAPTLQAFFTDRLNLTGADVTLTTGAHVHTIRNGRKHRRTSLVPATKMILKAWLAERAGNPTDPLFPTITGNRLSRDAIERRLEPGWL